MGTGSTLCKKRREEEEESELHGGCEVSLFFEAEQLKKRKVIQR